MASVMMTVAAVLFAFIQVSVSIPFIQFHGLGSACSVERVANLTEQLSSLSGSPGYCLEIGDGKPDSWFMPLTKQVSIACEKVKQMEELRKGYNIVAESQGNLIARGLIQFCEGGPPVRNYVSLAGPHAGIASVPMCGTLPLCELADNLMKMEAYTEFVQNHLAPSNYLKIPNSLSNYLEYSKYLPILNNERENERNSTLKDRFTSLQNLVLVMFEDDKVLVPRETSWFGFYEDGEFGNLLSPQQTKLYTEDWIGLKTLDAAGKVKFVSVPGEHIRMADEDVVKYVVPYIQDKASSEPSVVHRKLMQQRN